MEALPELLARKTVKFYACSNCWGELELRPDMREQGKYFAVCRKCQDDTKGYVTQYYVKRRQSESLVELRDATRMLRKEGVIDDPFAGMSRAEILKQLGF